MYLGKSCACMLFVDCCLLLMNDGCVVGPTSKALGYFAHNGFVCPPMINPPDFMMDVIGVCPVGELLARPAFRLRSNVCVQLGMCPQNSGLLIQTFHPMICLVTGRRLTRQPSRTNRRTHSFAHQRARQVSRALAPHALLVNVVCFNAPVDFLCYFAC